MKYHVLATAILIVFLTASVFAGTAAISGFDLNTTTARSLSGFNVSTLTFSNNADINALCFSTQDNNTSSKCLVGDSFSAPIDLNHNVIEGFSANDTNGSYTIYVFAIQDDGNYSNSMSKTMHIDSLAPTYTTYPTNGIDYNTNSFTFDINFSDSSTPISSLIKLDSNTTITDGQSLTSLGDGSHTITVDANDALGNSLTTATITFVVDTNAPTSTTITSSYLTSYTNDEEPDIALSATDSVSGMATGKVAFSCKSNGTYQEFAYAAAISSFNITTSTYDCNTADGNKAIYAKFRDEAGNWTTSAVVTYIQYDNTAPSSPTGLTATASNQQVSLTWSAPAADNLSGNAGYKIYKDGTLYTTTTSTSSTITGLTNGTSYSFTVSTYDNAGNESSQGSAASATPTSGTASVIVRKNSIEADYVKSGDGLSVGCSYSNEVDAARIKYRYYTPTQDAQTLTGPTDNVTSLSGTLTISSTNYASVSIWCEGTISQTITSSEKSIIIDNNAPTVTWADTNTVLKGMVRLYVTATDNKILEKVEFLFNNVYYGTNKEVASNRYYFDFNTSSFDNGNYTLKAVGTDRAGNKRTIERNITLENTLSAKQKAQTAINAAKTKQQSANDLMNYFKSQGLVLSAELTAKKEQADELLSEAQNILESNAVLAQEKAINARTLYEEVSASTSVETIKTDIYEYSVEMIADKLRAAGLGEEYIAQAVQAIENSGMERKLKIVKVGADSYQASIFISFVNDTNESQIKVIEVIPKAFVVSATSIYSNNTFEIIQSDPIIEFAVSAAPGTSVTLSYGIGEITKAQADALVANNVIATFSSPPIILPQNVDSKQAFSSTFYGAIMMTIVGVLIVIIIAVIILFVVMHKKNGGGKFGSASIFDPFKPKKQIKAEKKWGFEKK